MGAVRPAAISFRPASHFLLWAPIGQGHILPLVLASLCCPDVVVALAEI